MLSCNPSRPPILIASVCLLTCLIATAPVAGQTKWLEVQFEQVPKPLKRIDFDLQAKPGTAEELNKWYSLPSGAEDNTNLWSDAAEAVPDFNFSTKR